MMDAFSIATPTIHSQETFKVKEESHFWCVANIFNQTSIRTKIHGTKQLRIKVTIVISPLSTANTSKASNTKVMVFTRKQEGNPRWCYLKEKK